MECPAYCCGTQMNKVCRWVDMRQHGHVYYGNHQDNVFDFADRNVREIMIPRTDMVCLYLEDSFEENMFHIIRAFHVVGRCTDCGECSRVCPQNIPLHLLNRKFIKDINGFYGEYQAGAEVGSRAPIVDYTKEDLEPSEAVERGEENA